MKGYFFSNSRSATNFSHDEPKFEPQLGDALKTVSCFWKYKNKNHCVFFQSNHCVTRP